MALAFLLNPARRTRRKKAASRRKTRRRCSPGTRRRGARCRPRTAAEKRRHYRSRALRSARRGHTQVGEYGDAMGVFDTNPRKPRRKRKMATKRRRARRGWRGRKPHKKFKGRLYRSRKGRFTGRKTKRHANPRRRKSRRRPNPIARNPRRRSRRRRNPLAVRGGMYHNPKRRRRSRRRRNPLAVRGGMYHNPRRRRKSRGHSRRRRNPFSMGGTIGSLKQALTSPESLMQIGAAAAGATVSSFLGSIIASKIASFAPGTFTGTLGTILSVASQVAAGVLVGGFLPPKFKGAFVMGAGAMAAKPLLDMALAPILASTGLAVPVPSVAAPGSMQGVGAWISAGQMATLGRGAAGMGAWISAGQMNRLGQGTAGMKGLGRLGSFYSWEYGSPGQAVSDYSGQPAATLSSYFGN